MISAQSKFKLVERGFQKTLVLVPGWASDYRIFVPLDLGYNYLLPVEFNPFGFDNSLKEFLRQHSLGKVSMFGLSLGGFVAAEFAAMNPGLIDELFLISIRRRYNLKVLQDIELKLQKNRKAFLHKFYLAGFAKRDKEGLSWFKKNLLKRYLEGFKTEELLRGLDYLSSTYLKPESLSAIQKLKIFHGKMDAIAPVKEAQVIKSYLPQAELICIENSGHLFHLNPDFKIIFNG